MGKLIKKAKGIIIFAIIELFFYFKLQPKNLELFFMVWTLIPFALLLFNVFNVKSDGSLIGLGFNDQSRYANLAGTMSEKEYNTSKDKLKTYSVIFDPINLIYI
ncbi:hypothetical protein [Crassaminicella indica]|uniref:Uncharacterized protein n=1 Tax=Crassaminicella indica TaxID=2855394 RepID=A0ABX8R8Z5_9CLOT|nr:hypothetical protein [Crassaminicella indica]QXM05503.1 hypothetical protein KVH43_08945 [Crassaminicella indica]